MSFLIISPNRDPQVWVEAIKELAPEIDLEIYPEVRDPDAVEFALCWNHPPGAFRQFPNLKAISSMGAGIDHILQDREIPNNIKITRVIDEQLSEDMSIFVLSLVLEHLRNLTFHHCGHSWERKMYQRPQDVRIGIMGLGVLGSSVAKKLKNNGFKVSGWSRTPKDLSGIRTFHGDHQLNHFLENSEILICLLPLTSETENILKKDLFEKLPKNAYLINVARGKHLVENDLLEALRSGHLSGASLDVFREEPLPQNHAFWSDPRIKITPHVASITSPSSVAPQIIENYYNLKNNLPLKNEVSRDTGY